MLPLAACGGAGTSGPVTNPSPSSTPTPAPTPDPTPAPQPSASANIETVYIPSPGASPAIVPTDTKTVSGSYTVDADTTLLASPGAAIFSSTGTTLQFTNNGALWAVAEDSVPLALEAQTITNNGLIVSHTETSSSYAIGAFEGDVTNNGQVYAISDQGNPTAIYMEGAGRSLANIGEIYTESLHSNAWGVTVYGTPGNIDNSGTIVVSSGVVAIGVGLDKGGSVVNSGEIYALPIHADKGGSDDAFSIAVTFHSGSGNTLDNSGTIAGNVAIGSLVPVAVTNSGYLGGAILLSDQADQVMNTGEIDGPVLLAGGDDTFDSQDGTLDYFVDGGDGNDTIHGSAGDDDLHGGAGDDMLYGHDGDDTVTGDDGNDQLEGNGGIDTLNGGADNDNLSGGAGDDRLDGGLGIDTLYGDDGNDWIYGARGNDAIYGGAGNDGLYGGVGDDALVLEGADRAEGGIGDDTFSIIDREFALIDGGDGKDTLLLAGDAMSLDLSAFAADSRLSNLEVIELGTSDIALDGTALDGITGTSADLHVLGDASNTVDLVGSGWTDMGTVVQSETFHEYTNGGKAIYISDAVTIAMDASTPSGYDGPAAPTATGTAPELGTAPQEYEFTHTFSPTEDFHVYADETFTKHSDGAVFTLYDIGINVVDDGTISSIVTGSDNAAALTCADMGTFSGTGDIIATAEDGSATGVGIGGFGVIDFDGNITATSTGAHATGISTADSSASPVSLHGGSVTVQAAIRAVGIHIENGGDNTIYSDVTVEGGYEATGIEMGSHTANITIGGDIVVSGSQPDVTSVGIEVLSSLGTTTEIHNYGLLQADTAIHCNQSVFTPGINDYVDHIVNSGTIKGDIYTNVGNDVIENSGVMTGNVYLEGNDDTFIAFQSVTGIVDGGDGNDTYDLSSAGTTVDFADLATGLDNFETIALNGAGDFDCSLALQDVLDITDDNNQLAILGDAGDSVTSAAEGWTQGADQTIDSTLFHVYTLDSATLLVDADINQTIL